MIAAAHFPVLQVVLPLLAAPVCVLLRHATLAWLAALAPTESVCALFRTVSSG